MALPYHHAYSGTQLHRVARDFADASELAAFVPTADDNGKLYKQLDTGVVYELTDYSGPTYEVFNAAGISAGIVAANVFTPSTKADVLQAAVFAVDSGAANAYIVTLSPAITAYVLGACYRFGASNANTGASTVDINGVGAVSIVKVAGGITTALAANDIRAGQLVELIYDGTNMQLQSTLGNAPFTALTKSDVLQAALIAGADSGAADAYAVSFSPAITAYVTDARYCFRAANANTGASTVNFNSLGTKSIKKKVSGTSTALAANDIRANQWCELVYDGTDMIIVSRLGNDAGSTPDAASQAQMEAGTETSILGMSPLRVAQAIAALANKAALGANEQTGTTYTLALTDLGKIVGLSNASAITLTVPPNSSVAFPIGSAIPLEQVGAGQVTFAPGSGVTIRSRDSALKIAGQYGSALLIKRDTDIWNLSGDITT